MSIQRAESASPTWDDFRFGNLARYRVLGANPRPKKSLGKMIVTMATGAVVSASALTCNVYGATSLEVTGPGAGRRYFKERPAVVETIPGPQWHDQQLETTKSMIEQIKLGHALVDSQEMRRLAERAVTTSRNLPTDRASVETWAAELAESVADATD